MPPKRRKVADLTDAPEQKRRVTRSSSKPSAPTKAATTPKPAKTSAKASNSAKSSSSKAKPVRASNEVATKDAPATPDVLGSNPLTIHPASAKKPIECYSYQPTTPYAPFPNLIFTHGAGGTLSAPAVVNFCTGYGASAPVLAFQGSMNLTARVKNFGALTEHYNPETRTGRLIVGGRSMGARAAAMLWSDFISKRKDAESIDVSFILVSYPLKGPKGDIRDQILLDLPHHANVLFVIGEKDAMCPLDMLSSVRRRMSASSQLIVVRGADHGMHVKPAEAEKRFGEETGRLAAAWANGGMKEHEVYIGDEA